MCGFASGADLVRAAPEEIIAHYEILDADRRPFKTENLPGRRVLAGEEPSSTVLYVRERATRRDSWVQLRANAVLGSDGKPELAINIWHDVTAEHRQEMHTRYLAEASAALASSLNREEMLTALARVLVPKMADWCSVDLLDGERLRDVTVVGATHDDSSASPPHGHDHPSEVARSGAVWSVIRSGTPEVFNDLSESAFARSNPDSEALSLLAAVGVKAALIVPIRMRDRVLGAIGLYFGDASHRYDASDLALVEELGRRAGGAVENAELYKAAQDAARAAEIAAEKAEAAARLAEEASRAKDEFLATVSHELRTPLNAILGWSTLLKDRLSETSAAKPIEVIHRNAHAQARIIDDILDVSRVVTGKFNLDLKPADLAVVVRHAIDVVRPSAEAKRIAIDFVPEVEFPLVVVDAERIQQVVWNLLSNAVKFTPNGGRIQIELRHERSQLILIVKDTGEGIDPAFLPLVFDRFKQADSSTTRRVGGLGLGLALVRHIVELHGGRVEASSDGLGKGSTFRLSLPIRAVMPQTITSSLPPQPTAEQYAHPGIALHGVRVLVVDDEPDARHLIAAVLSEAGADVKAAPSASDGFAMFKEFRPNVVVSDIGMPEEDGFSFIQRIRALPAGEGGQVPSLALTAFAHERDRERALKVGYTTHLGKPVEPQLLATTVASLVGLPAPDEAGHHTALR
jgi:signal transduction histidine kinase/ActR/RegA family two-component response regulator